MGKVKIKMLGSLVIGAVVLAVLALIFVYSFSDVRKWYPLFVLSKERTHVMLAFGQSNSANYGETRKTAGKNVYNYHNGRLYSAVDPLLGGGSDGGSVWTRLGDKIINANIAESVVFVSIGKGGSRIKRWSENGDLNRKLMRTLEQLEKDGLNVTHLLWHQGETDAIEGTSTQDYKDYFLKMLESIRNKGVDAPIYISIASRCRERGPSETIQTAQRELVDISKGILQGPNTDELGAKYRYDYCHFSGKGLEKVADLWFEVLF